MKKGGEENQPLFQGTANVRWWLFECTCAFSKLCSANAV